MDDQLGLAVNEDQFAMAVLELNASSEPDYVLISSIDVHQRAISGFNIVPRSQKQPLKIQQDVPLEFGQEIKIAETADGRISVYAFARQTDAEVDSKRVAVSLTEKLADGQVVRVAGSSSRLDFTMRTGADGIVFGFYQTLLHGEFLGRVEFKVTRGVVRDLRFVSAPFFPRTELRQAKFKVSNFKSKVKAKANNFKHETLNLKHDQRAELRREAIAQEQAFDSIAQTLLPDQVSALSNSIQAEVIESLGSQSAPAVVGAGSPRPQVLGQINRPSGAETAPLRTGTILTSEFTANFLDLLPALNGQAIVAVAPLHSQPTPKPPTSFVTNCVLTKSVSWVSPKTLPPSLIGWSKKESSPLRMTTKESTPSNSGVNMESLPILWSAPKSAMLLR
jgi:hypothetical protein